MLLVREKGQEQAVGETMELSKSVCSRSKKFGVANGEREGDQWPGQRVVKLDGVKL